MTRERLVGHSLLALTLAALTFAVWWPVLDLPFVDYDDPRYVVENAAVLGGLTLDGVAWALTSEHVGNWHPLTGMSHMLDVSLFGTDPRGHHATSLVLHALNVVLVYALGVRTTGATWRSAFVAALFAVHPLRVESVAWIAERKDVLSTCLGLLCTAAYVGWTRRRGVGRYVLVAVLLALALMAKPMVVTLPCVFLLLDVWPLERWPKVGLGRLIAEKLPLLLLAVAGSVATLLAQSAGGAMREGMVPLGGRVANAVVSYARYLGKAFWPVDLAVLYPHPWRPGGTPWSAVVIAGAAVLLAGVTLGALLSRKRWAIVGWLAFLGTLVPVIGLVQVGDQALADRYTYAPLLGVFVLVGWGAAAVLEGAFSRTPALRRVAAVAAGILLTALALRTRDQIGVWSSSVRLFEHSAQAAPGSAIVHSNLGNALKRARRTLEAEDHYRYATELDPTHAAGWHNLGVTLYDQGERAEAERCYLRAVELTPDYLEPWINLGVVRNELGRLDESIAATRRALELAPDVAIVHYNLGLALLKQGDAAAALESFDAALALAPGQALALRDRGAALLQLGRSGDAVASYEAALEQLANDAHAHLAYANALEPLDPGGALRHARIALALDPGSARAHLTFGRLALAGHRPAAALESFETALRTAPGTREAIVGVTAATQGLELLRAEIRLQRERVASGVEPPDSGASLLALADMLDRAGDELAALEALGGAEQEARPDDVRALVEASRIRSTSRDPAVRNTAEALHLAELALERSPERTATVLETLARAAAAHGDPARGLALAEEAFDTAPPDDGSAARRLRERIALYGRAAAGE